MRALILCCLGLLVGGCTGGPCVPIGEYELFALRGPGPLDGGPANCPEVLQGTLQVRSATAAHFALDGGPEGDCLISATDNRPRFACQVRLTCSAPTGQTLEASSFVGPEAQQVIDGFSGASSPRIPLRLRANGCEAEYAWAAALRGQP